MENRRQPGDIYFFKGKGLISMLVRILTSVRYGIPLKYALSHVELCYDEENNISAESAGIKLVPPGKADWVFRLTGMTQAKQEKLKVVTGQYLETGYAFARYIQDFFLVLSFFSLLAAVGLTLPTLFGYPIYQIIAGSIFAISIIIRIVVKKADRKTMDCSELVGAVLSELDLIKVYGRTRDLSPNALLNICLTFEKKGEAKRISGEKNDEGE